MRLRHLALVVVLFMGAGPGVAGAGGLPEFCSPVLSGVTCIYDSSRVGDNPVHFDALVDALNTYLNALTPPQEITGADGVVIEAWGGQGGAGRNGSTFQFCSGGHRGDPGYARTARQVSDVSAVLTDGKLYILVGKKGADQGGQGGEGGAGSLVLRKPYMDIDDVTDPVGEGVYVIAGGGGGAGGCDDLTLDGSAGGVGGVAVANLFNIAVTASGGDSPEPCFFFGSCGPRFEYGRGGNRDFAGGGGSQDASDSFSHGSDGIGGWGGAFDGEWTTWVGTNLGSVHGRGGVGGLDPFLEETNQLSGHGGGGFGGGGGGTTYTTDVGELINGMGGGGGGSWARIATIDESTLLVLGQGAGPGNQGRVTLSFHTDEDFEADLSITKDDGVTSAVPGQSVVYTIVVSNAGPSNAQNVMVKDTFPSELSCSWTSVAAGGATGHTDGAGNLDETLDMPTDSSVTYTVTCAIDPGATGTLSNTATIHDTLSDPGPNPNTATDDNTVLTPMADVSITKDDGVTSAVPGQDTIAYTIVVASAGPSDDPAVSVMDTFPAALDCSWTSVVSGLAGGNGSGSGPALDETLAMAPGSSVTYTVTCSIDPAATGTLSNTATATASVTDPGSGLNSATDNNTVLIPEADLDLAKHTVDELGDDPQLYDQFQYELVVTNNGPSTVPSAEVTDVLPEQLAFVDSDCGMTAVGQTVTWVIGVLGPDESISCLLTVEMVNFAHVVVNGASVDSPVDDPSGNNNADSSEALGVMPIIPAVGLYGLLLLIVGFGGLGAWRLRRAH